MQNSIFIIVGFFDLTIPLMKTSKWPPGGPKMADESGNGFISWVFGCYGQLSQNKFFDTRTRFVRKGCDGEEKLKKKNVEKSGPLTFLPVNLLNSNQLQPQSSSQINKEETKWYWIRLGSSGLD